MAMTLKERRIEKGGRFKLLAGHHIDVGPDNCECEQCLKSEGKGHIYSQGDVFNSRFDLVKRFNQEPFSRKFEKVYNETGEPKSLPLTSMSMRQLLAVARDEGVDVKEIGTKKGLIEALESAKKAG